MKYPKLFHLALTLVCLKLTPLISQAWGTIYLSNTDTINNGAYGVAGTDWLGQPFKTGTSPGGYTLNAIDLPMGYGESGVTNFRVSIYNSTVLGRPGTVLGTLSGSTDPSLSGMYSYTSSGMTLSAGTAYWIVAAADNTPSATGFSGYFWSDTRDTVFNAVDGWQIPFGNTHAVYYVSAGQWTLYASSTYGAQQFAIEATAVPEPATLALIITGAAALCSPRRSFRTRGNGRPLEICLL